MIERFQDFETHEVFSDLIESEDYPKLVQYCERCFKDNPDDVYSAYHLGDAYVLNGEYNKAIDFLEQHINKFPDNQDFQYVILEALFKLGKSENDFNWTIKPKIHHLNLETMNYCYNYLKPKRKPISFYDIHANLWIDGYVNFSEQQLLTALRKDSRFVVDSNDDIRVIRKKDLKNVEHNT